MRLLLSRHQQVVLLQQPMKTLFGDTVQACLTLRQDIPVSLHNTLVVVVTISLTG
jgi:hypothetical protein